MYSHLHGSEQVRTRHLHHLAKAHLVLLERQQLTLLRSSRFGIFVALTSCSPGQLYKIVELICGAK